MKKSLIFIIIFIKYINAIYACGYYPYGEDIRFSLFGPEYFDYQEFKDFFYNANIIGSNDNPNTYYQSNVYDWYSFINQEVSIDEINECLNYLKFTDIDSSSTNQFVKYLFNNNLHKIIKYLKVAKKSEDFSTVYNADPWERNDSLRRNYSSLLAELNKHIADEEDDYFKRKYAFLCIRSAYYCGSFTLIYNLFHKYFEKGKRDYLYYWASYFNLFNNPHPSVDMANIMAYSTEKRYACYFYFHNQFKLERDLLKAKSSNDLANLYAFASVQRLDPNLEYLKIIYNNCAKSRILDFLLLREINKIEDWVYTPYYTNYLPSTTYSVNWNSNLHYTKLSTEALRARSEKDRLYAKKVLEFINSVNYDKIRDISLWKAAKIQLLFITRKYTDCLKEIEYFERQYSNDRIFKQIEKIKVLCIVSHQKTGTTIINEEVKSIILGNLLDEHFCLRWEESLSTEAIFLTA